MRILALEPYYGGSHRAFLDGWIQHSCHTWYPLTLPAHKWKWRMRHAAVSFATEVNRRIDSGETWDLLFATDMLDLATLLGLAQATVRSLPIVAYFHENQLTYPVTVADERDHHFGYTNFTTALAADAVWFNSQFHLDSFYEALRDLLNKMPDNRMGAEVEFARSKSSVQPIGVDSLPFLVRNSYGPLRILWAARWEHDKNPEDFWAAIDQLEEQQTDFRLDVIGETFRDIPPVFTAAHQRLAHRIERWGYQSTRNAYLNSLADADVFVSTAKHEFFGIAAVEAIMAGAYPLLPRRLAYPEWLPVTNPGVDELFFYDGTPQHLSKRLVDLAERKRNGESLHDAASLARDLVKRFEWKCRAQTMDEAVAEVARRGT
jgi:glycosyltransferase involved in cell wall biosynthesis